MNKIDELLANGLAEQIKSSITPGQTYLLGPSGLSSSANEFSKEFRTVADKIKASAPEDSRISAWFCLNVEGTRLDGQICLDVDKDAPQIVWTIGKENPEVDYFSRQTVSFSSASDRLIAEGDPIEMMRSIGTKHDKETAALVENLGYVPIWPLHQEKFMSFDTVGLVQAHD